MREKDETMEKVEYSERKRWVFLGLPWTFTKYHVKDDMVTTDRGFFNKTEDDCYMYKIQDVKLTSSFFERIVGLGTVVCFTGDVTDQKMELLHIRHAKEIKNYILEKSEVARIRRRTLNMQNIGVDPHVAFAENDDIDLSMID
ncbi:MAG: PH domain-containing protein [Lachnospiraceae bacterium]|nr:PH domain-containing protein [Lachnospiraceae bacterium]